MRFLTAIFYSRTGDAKVIYFENPHDKVNDAVLFTQQRVEEVRKEKNIKTSDIKGRTFELEIQSYDLR